MTIVRARMKLTLGHSPDPDDAFMFYALAKHKIPTAGFRFAHFLADIETLNELAQKGKLDITAISLHAYAYLTETYALLSSGASMGEGYGPIVVAKNNFTVEELRRMQIAVPGEKTTAFLALKMHLGDFRYRVVPFDKILREVTSGKVAAGLLIHEGQLTYAKEGLVKLVDLGEWWLKKTGLPLPLGVNVVKKSLGKANLVKISKVLRESIAFGLKHRRDALEHAKNFGRGIDDALTDKFVAMYVNKYTEDFGPRGRKAVELFLQEAAAKGLIPPVGPLEFV